jgi:hypothetical protein
MKRTRFRMLNKFSVKVFSTALVFSPFPFQSRAPKKKLKNTPQIVEESVTLEIRHRSRLDTGDSTSEQIARFLRETERCPFYALTC